MKKLLFCLLILITAFSVKAKTRTFMPLNNDEKLLMSFLKEVTDSSFNGSALYKKYFYIADSGQPDRSKEEIKWYTDTLFQEIHDSLSKYTYEVYKLAEARKKFKTDSLPNYYYDAQKKIIYVIAVKTGYGFQYYYCLVAYKKIVSLYPNAVIDEGIIGWR